VRSRSPSISGECRREAARLASLMALMERPVSSAAVKADSGLMGQARKLLSKYVGPRLRVVERLG